MTRLIQFLPLLTVIISHTADAQNQTTDMLKAIRDDWEGCVLMTSAMRTPRDGRIDYAEIEGAFSDCNSEEKYLLASIDLLFRTPDGRAQAVALFYKRRVELKAKIVAELLDLTKKPKAAQK